MQLNITVIPGDGIGPEISAQGVAAVEAVARRFGHRVDFTYALAGAAAIDACGDPFPPESLRKCLDADAVLFSAVGHPKYDLDPTAPVRPEQGLLAMRKQLGLYANLRPVSTYPSLLSRSPLKDEVVCGADLLCVRELTGGMYFGRKHQDNDSAYDTNEYSRPEIERILRVGFEWAMRRRRRLTVVDKANVLATSRLWRVIAKELAPQYPQVEMEFMYIDNASMRIVTDPRHFDVIVTENTFGDILTDEASVIGGSMGLLPSASIGEKTPLFEPVHGSWPEAAGKGIANPVAQILSAAMMLEYLGLDQEGRSIREAVDASLAEGVVTPDLDATSAYTTSDVGRWIADRIL